MSLCSTSTQTLPAEDEEAEAHLSPILEEPMPSGHESGEEGEREEEGEGDEEEEEESEGELEVDLEKGHNGAVSPGTMDSSEDSNNEEN